MPVKRILETLVAEGPVRDCDCHGAYGLAPQVIALGNELTEEAHVLRQAVPALQRLGDDTG